MKYICELFIYNNILTKKSLCSYYYYETDDRAKYVVYDAFHVLRHAYAKCLIFFFVKKYKIKHCLYNIL